MGSWYVFCGVLAGGGMTVGFRVWPGGGDIHGGKKAISKSTQ